MKCSYSGRVSAVVRGQHWPFVSIFNWMLSEHSRIVRAILQMWLLLCSGRPVEKRCQAYGCFQSIMILFARDFFVVQSVSLRALKTSWISRFWHLPVTEHGWDFYLKWFINFFSGLPRLLPSYFCHHKGCLREGCSPSFFWLQAKWSLVCSPTVL